MANTIENKRYFSFQPNVGQQEAFDELCFFLDEDNSEDFFILTGAAGTGKTSVVSAITNYLQDKSIACVLAAPTGRAAHVISSKTNRTAKTIHSLIYIPEVNGDTGSIIYKRKHSVHD
jgi:ATP-dependent exoDNAse (exonuclease V) alpha subunit